jgi:transporter family-2 protein
MPAPQSNAALSAPAAFDCTRIKRPAPIDAPTINSVSRTNQSPIRANRIPSPPDTTVRSERETCQVRASSPFDRTYRFPAQVGFPALFKNQAVCKLALFQHPEHFMTLISLSIAAVVILVGAALAFQAPVNAALAKGLGDPVMAALVQFGIGFVVLASIALFRSSAPSVAQLKTIPWWALTGGLLGAVWVLAAIWSVPRLGLVTMFAAMIFGQLIAALFIDAGGIFDIEARSISPTRICAILLVAAGLLLSYR